jgi:hypothetical protein
MKGAIVTNKVKNKIFKIIEKVEAKRKHYNNKFKFKFKMLLKLNAVGVKLVPKVRSDVGASTVGTL